MTLSDEPALLRAILAHPDEDTHRLVYADWLEEHGDRVALATARFIRNHVRGEMPTTPPLVMLTQFETAIGLQPHEMERRGFRRGVAVVAGKGWTLRFDRGFVSEVVCPTAAAWLAHGPDIVARHPVESGLRLTDRTARDDRFLPRSGFVWARTARWPEVHGSWIDTPERLPPMLFDALDKPDNNGAGAPFPTVAEYQTREAANLDISTGALRWARAEAARRAAAGAA